ncbi:hypothetical protein LOZ36_005199 [Ophidiomyces ophidiicola]|nr:hypothetical protein LOZ36_005199 [Ophidiomyces ophidiicola]
MATPPVTRVLSSAYDSPTFGEDSSFHVEQPIGSMSISPCGRDVVLASKEGLHIIDLDNPYTPPRYLAHRTPWEVADVQWSPFAARDMWVVSTSNQKALVWNLAMVSCQNSIELVLHAHSRAITDINFSAHHPDILATCAVDSFVHCWDLRAPARPAISFSDWFAGATQVKWNRQDSHIIASSHDRFLHIWDDRHGALPVRSIEAHNTKIYGLDWNRMRPEALVTCSLDRTIKFWDYSVESDLPEKIIHTHFPVWRARHTPFGWGVLAMPQRGNSDLHLYSRTFKNAAENPDMPPLVYSFPGHKGQVKEFLWRPRGSVINGLDHREFQLVSWGTDRELRLHRVSPEILKSVGFEKGRSFNPSLNITRAGAVYKTYHDENSGVGSMKRPPGESSRSSAAYRRALSGKSGITMPYSRQWQGGPNGHFRDHGRQPLRTDMNPISWMRGVKVSGWEVETLGDEITHVGERFTKVSFESVNVNQRKATVSLHGPWGSENTNTFLRVDIKFPSNYPRSAAPAFTLQKSSTISIHASETVAKGLHSICEAYILKKRPSLEGALRYLLGEYTVEEIVDMVQDEVDEALKSPDILGDGESSDEDEEIGQYQGNDLAMSSSELLRPVNANVMVPIARVCGAIWTHDGRLVCFFPHKEEVPASFLDSVGLREMTRLSRSNRVFEAFGRFKTNSPGPRNPLGMGASNDLLTDDDASEYSDNSDDSSSSSGSSDMLGALPQRFHLQRTSNIGANRARSTDNSQKSTTGVSAMRSTTGKRHNTISIHNLTHILPSKPYLATKYRIHGACSDVCTHNMKVSADFGHMELAHIWGLLKLVLESLTPFHSTPKHEDVSHMVYQVMGNNRRKDSGVDLTYDDCSTETLHMGTVGWGSHPLGSKWLLPALFEYFEQLGDVQMLGMLSYILSEPISNSFNQKADQVPSNLQNPAFVLSQTSPPLQIRRENSSSGGPIVSPTKDLPLISTSYSSACSSTDIWPSETPPLYSTGATPPNVVRSGRTSLERKSYKLATPVSGSPDQHTHLRTLNNGLPLSSSLSQSLPNEPLAPSSLSESIKKRASPAGSLTAASGWAGNISLVKLPSAIPDHIKTSTAPPSQVPSDTENEALSVQKPLKPSIKSSLKPRSSIKPSRDVRVVLKNQKEFDAEGIGDLPPFDNKHQPLYPVYRAAYAALLFAWDTPVAGREILKTEPSNDNQYAVLRVDTKRSKSAAIFSYPKPEESDNLEGLGFQQHCSTCNSPLDLAPNTKPELQNGKSQAERLALTCSTCKTENPQRKFPCIVCDKSPAGTFAPCLACGHIACRLCHEKWLAFQEISENGTTPACPAGCGCICTEHITNHVAVPQPPKIVVEGELKPRKEDALRRKFKRACDFLNIYIKRPSSHIHLTGRKLSRSCLKVRSLAAARGQSRINFERVHLKPILIDGRTGN